MTSTQFDEWIPDDIRDLIFDALVSSHTDSLSQEDRLGSCLFISRIPTSRAYTAMQACFNLKQSSELESSVRRIALLRDIVTPTLASSPLGGVTRDVREIFLLLQHGAPGAFLQDEKHASWTAWRCFWCQPILPASATILYIEAVNVEPPVTSRPPMSPILDLLAHFGYFGGIRHLRFVPAKVLINTHIKNLRLQQIAGDASSSEPEAYTVLIHQPFV
ncbi:hypothetical protein BDZ97DRAFT_1111479 [Flammula alnicola]|nr:hypothetical protein BDZ97DRAFT_1111479 [Flammula alnicola]